MTLPQVLNAVSSSNANVGGNYLTLGSQSVNVRGIGLLQTMDDMKNVIVSEHNGVPVFLRDIAEIREGFSRGSGKWASIMPTTRSKASCCCSAANSRLPALRALRDKISALNHGLLPHGMTLEMLYDRTNLIHMTTDTIWRVVIEGLSLVTLILIVFLGDVAHLADRGADDSVFAAVRAFADGPHGALREPDFARAQWTSAFWWMRR